MDVWEEAGKSSGSSILLGCVCVANGCVGSEGEEAGPAELHCGLSVLARVKTYKLTVVAAREGKVYAVQHLRPGCRGDESAAATDSLHWQQRVQPSSGREPTLLERESLYSPGLVFSPSDTALTTHGEM